MSPLNSDYPVGQPLITGVLLDAIHEANEAEGRRPKAFDTVTRYSDAGRCGRAIGFEAAGTEQSDPPDLAGEWVMWLGKLIHDQMQDAILATFPGAVVEQSSRIEDIVSGHADAFFAAAIVSPEHGRVCYELKTRGAFGFDKAVGLRRRQYVQEAPEGPGATTKLQGALNAAALDCDLLVIGVIAMEAVSKQLAEKVGFSDPDRVMAEWHYTKAEFGPWAQMELDRMEAIANDIATGTLPAPIAVGDEMEIIRLNPHAHKRPWQCSYCSHLTTCLSLA